MPVDVERRWERLVDLRGPDLFAMVADRVTRTAALRRLSSDLVEVVASLLEATRDRFCEQGRMKAADYRLFLECFDEVAREVAQGERAAESARVTRWVA